MHLDGRGPVASDEQHCATYERQQPGRQEPQQRDEYLSGPTVRRRGHALGSPVFEGYGQVTATSTPPCLHARAPVDHYLLLDRARAAPSSRMIETVHPVVRRRTEARWTRACDGPRDASRDGLCDMARLLPSGIIGTRCLLVLRAPAAWQAQSPR